MNPTHAALAIALFYAAFLAIGVRAARRARESDSDSFLLANRQLPLFVGIATMTATWVGGGYIVGTAEAVFDPNRGLLWTQAPWCYAISLILGGVFFARRMHRGRFTTLLDLFERRYGKRIAAVMYLPALCGELFWAAAILTALGSTMSTVLDLPMNRSIIMSAVVVVSYTLLGGLWSVAYTDVLQLFCILFGLIVALFFASQGFSTLADNWHSYEATLGDAAAWHPPLTAFGTGDPWVWQWCDFALLLMLGGIPWQVYFQRVFACKTANHAALLSIFAGIGCLLLAIPNVLIGVIGVNTDWSQTTAEQAPQAALVLPYVLRYLTPHIVAVIGLSAIAAAVMSSVDSSLLSAGSMFAWNIYRPLMRPNGGESGLRMILRGSIIVLGVIATVLAIQVQSVYALWYLCAELVYVILFPQLVLSLYVRRVNGIGALVGSTVGLLLRLGGGEPMIGLQPVLNYPWYDEAIGSQFPLRTFAMICGLVTSVVVSRVTLFWMPARELGLDRVASDGYAKSSNDS